MTKKEKITLISNLFKIHYSMLFHYGMRVVNSKVMVEEGIQELFLELLKYNTTLHQIKNMKSYLLVIFRKRLIKEIKKENARQKRIQELPLPNIRFSLEDWKSEETQNKEVIIKSFNDLPKRQREAAYLKYFEGFDNEEIAKIMEITHQGVLNMFYKIMKKLRNDTRLRQLLGVLTLIIHFF